MSEWASTVLLRFFAGGVVCSLIMTFAGEGAQREIARILCAALMIILILTPVKQINLSGFDWLQTEETLDFAVSEALKSSQLAQKRQADEQLRQQIESQAAALGVTCTAAVVSELSEAEVYSVQQVILRFGDDVSAAEKPQVIRLAALLCGIEEECVFEETGTSA